MILTGTYDIECSHWTKFKVAATFDGTNTKIHRTRDELVDYLLYRGGTWFAHCGGQYDGLAVADVLDKRGLACQIDYPRSRMTRLVTGSLTLRDSFALLPFRLEIVAAMAGVPCPKIPWPCICGLDCSGYCQIPNHSARDLWDYVVADCDVLYRGLEALIRFAKLHDIDLRGTAGGSAWATAQRDLSLPDANLTPRLWDRIEPADKGGRMGIYRPVAAGPGTHRDISSAYPAALASVSLPVGVPRELGSKNAPAAFLCGQAGIYQAVVDVPPSFLPPLPWRFGNRISYPHGVILGTWPANELQAAEARGARILSIRRGVAWRHQRAVFAPLIRHWYHIRRTLGKSTPFGMWIRELANSLTGKFGEQPERRTIRLHPPLASVVFCPRRGACRNGCEGACGAWTQIDRWGEMWSQPHFRLAPSGHLHWSAYLKAATRIAWLTEAERHGDQLVSGNTDSIWTMSRLRSMPEGTALGAWETKGTWTEWEARSSSCYRYRDSSTGKIVIRAAGASHMSEAEWNSGTMIRSRGVRTLVDAAQHGRGLFSRKNATWTLPGSDDIEWFGDRKLDASGLVTQPCDADELRERARRAAVRHGTGLSP